VAYTNYGLNILLGISISSQACWIERKGPNQLENQFGNQTIGIVLERGMQSGFTLPELENRCGKAL
jgi:hypothetical protein